MHNNHKAIVLRCKTFTQAWKWFKNWFNHSK